MAAQTSYKFFSNGRTYLGPYPIEKIKKVERPTTRITDQILKVDERESGFNRALRGDFGPLAQRERPRFVMKYPLSRAQAEMTAYLIPVVDGTVSPDKAPIPDEPELVTRHIKELAYFLRADLVGICQLPRYAIYSHDKDGKPVDLNHKFALAIVIDQGARTMSGSSGYDWISNSQSFVSYSTSAFIACILASYIRYLGYPARAHHARDYQVAVPPILLWAGMGEMCRIGDIVLNPFLGPRFKAAVVTTDLPLIPDKPIDFGLQDFCRRCLKCARECPAKAITVSDPVMYNGYEIWKPDVEACTKFRVTNRNGAGCGHCIKVCPWNKKDSWYHSLARWSAQRSAMARKALIWMDDLLGYGKPVEKDKWWFDLEEVDGKMEVR